MNRLAVICRKIAIGWSILMLLIVLVSCGELLLSTDTAASDAALGLSLAGWIVSQTVNVILWLIIAGPCTVIWLLGRQNQSNESRALGNTDRHWRD